MNYRLAWFLGLSLWIVPVVAQAQKTTLAGRSVDIGLKVGLTITNIGGDAVDDSDPLLIRLHYKRGVAVGGLVELALTPTVSLQSELLLATKGVEGEAFGDSIYISYTYLEVPILARVNIPAGPGLTPFVVAGPGVGILLSAERGNDDVSEDIKEETSSLDLGILVGAGAAVPLSSGGAIEIEVRYELGLRSANDEDDIENRAYFILGGYRF